MSKIKQEDWEQVIGKKLEKVVEEHKLDQDKLLFLSICIDEDEAHLFAKGEVSARNIAALEDTIYKLITGLMKDNPKLAEQLMLKTVLDLILNRPKRDKQEPIYVVHWTDTPHIYEVTISQARAMELCRENPCLDWTPTFILNERGEAC